MTLTQSEPAAQLGRRTTERNGLACETSRDGQVLGGVGDPPAAGVARRIAGSGLGKAGIATYEVEYVLREENSYYAYGFAVALARKQAETRRAALNQ